MRNIRVADRSEWIRAEPHRSTKPTSHGQRVVDWIATIPIITLLPALLLLLGPAAAAGPTLTVTPDHSVAGAEIRVSGVLFEKGERGVLAFDGKSAGLAPYRANGKGEFHVSLVIPEDATVGDHRISAMAGSEGASVERSATTLTVRGPTADAPASISPQVSGSTGEPAKTPAATPRPDATPTPDPTPTSTASVGPTPTAEPKPTAGSSADPANLNVGVRAYYYLWWSAKHWHDKLGQDYPYDDAPLPPPATTNAAGCDAISRYSGNQLVDVADPLFSQDDDSVIARDVRSAKSAGLVGFLLNWGGTGMTIQNESDSPYTGRLAAVLAASREVGGFTNWLSYKTSNMPSATAIINDATFIHSRYGSHVGWGRVAGKPVFVLTGSRKYTTLDLAEVSAALRPMYFLVGDESNATLTSARLRLFDGLTYYWSTQNPYTNPGSFSTITSMAQLVHAAGKPWFAPFTPGYNSQLLRGGSCVPRNDGDTMRRLWAGNRASKPDGWAFISWNEIAENTHIQPLEKWGDRYINVLRALIDSL
jgi:hypothetical protein